MINNYKSLCTLFYDLDKPSAPIEEYLFYLSYLQKYKINLLEPFCGSGRFLIPLLKEGFSIDAFDASPSMLISLEAKLKQNNLLCEYEYCLFKDYIFKKKYNLIFIPSGSLSLLSNKNEYENALKIIYNNLNHNGSFVFEVETPEILEKDKSDFKLIANHFIAKNSREKILGSFINYNYQDSALTTACRYDLICDDMIVKTEFEDITIRLFTDKEIVQILEKIGFTVFIYSDFNKTIYNKKNKLPKLLIIEAIKL